MSKILIIEDDELIVRLLTRLANKLGFSVISCEMVPTDEQLQQVCFVISDISLPQVVGISHIEKVAKWPGRLPLLVVSGMDPTTLESTQTLLKLLNVNLVGILKKPFNKQVLADTLIQHLEKIL